MDDDENDSDFKEEDELEGDIEGWDDDENPIVRRKAHVDQDEEDGEEEQDQVGDLSVSKEDIESKSSQSIRRVKRRQLGSQATSEAPSQLSAKERKALEQQRREKDRKKRELLRFLDEEAELGSDNEENDDVRKNIDREGDDEENEEGLDDDLGGFVVHGHDDDEIGDENSA